MSKRMLFNIETSKYPKIGGKKYCKNIKNKTANNEKITFDSVLLSMKQCHTDFKRTKPTNHRKLENHVRTSDIA